MLAPACLIFFQRRRGNTRFDCDWSSDVCSSDLTREFGSHLTNVLRCLQLEAHGYQVTVTELVGWEHSMKNELIVARRTETPRKNAQERLEQILRKLNLEELRERFIY